MMKEQLQGADPSAPRTTPGTIGNDVVGTSSSARIGGPSDLGVDSNNTRGEGDESVVDSDVVAPRGSADNAPAMPEDVNASDVVSPDDGDPATDRVAVLPALVGAT